MNKRETMTTIHLSKVSIAAIAAFIIGFLIHGPVAGKLYMAIADVPPTGNEKFEDMVPKILWNLIVQFVTAFVLSVIYLFASSSSYIGKRGIWGGVILAIWLWLGFLVTSSSIGVIWMGQDYKL